MSHVRPYGFHPLGWKAFLKTGISVERVGQTIGGARASGGTHLKDGEYEGHDYGACVDLRIGDLSDAGAIALLPKLAAVGFAGFFRDPGHDHWPSGEARHIHMIWADCDTKQIVRHQVRDWLETPVMCNGLASHAPYRAWQPDHALRLVVRTMAEKHYSV